MQPPERPVTESEPQAASPDDAPLFIPPASPGRLLGVYQQMKREICAHLAAALENA